MIKEYIRKLLFKLLPIQRVTIGNLHQLVENKDQCEIYQHNKLKFIEKGNVKNILVNTPKGLVPIQHTFKTVEYKEYILTLQNGLSITCADEHLVQTLYGDKQVQYLSKGDNILTKQGYTKVENVQETYKCSNMYDLELAGDYHYYYTNDIISHNTTTIGAFLLWYAMFTNDATVLVVSNKGDNAKEVIERIKFMYESCPLWLKPGVTDDGYNKHSLRFDNGSRIISQATSENSGRGLSISLLFCYGGNNTVEVMDDEGKQFKLTLDELYEYMV